MDITFSAANTAGLNNPGTEIITLVKDESGNFINPPSYDKMRAYLRSGEVPVLFVTDEGGETGSLYQLADYSETENKIRFSNDTNAIEFGAGAAAPVVSDVGGGTNDVYLIKQITNTATGAKELQGDYAGALAAWQSGKSIQFTDVFLVDGNEFVYTKSFTCAYTPSVSRFSFSCYDGQNFITYQLTESGITSSGKETHVGSLYVDTADSLFLKSGEGSHKVFRINVSGTGELTTEEVT